MVPGSGNGLAPGAAGVAQPKKDPDEHAEASVGEGEGEKWSAFCWALEKTGAPCTVCLCCCCDDAD
jgi:hypothetical protein